jgi:hypothetical protein
MVGRQRQFELRRPRIVAESRRLGVPVQLAGAFGVGFEAMFGTRVVGADNFL